MEKAPLKGSDFCDIVAIKREWPFFVLNCTGQMAEDRCLPALHNENGR